MRRRILYTALALPLLVARPAAADGELDPRFAFGTGRVQLSLDRGRTMDNGGLALGPQGDLIALSNVHGPTGNQFLVFRVVADGSGQASSNFFSFNPNSTDRALAIATNAAGRVVAVGSTPAGAPPATLPVLGALTTPGLLLDGTFGGGDGKLALAFPGSATARAVTVLPDGRVAWAGSAVIDGETDFAFGLLAANGNFDPGFAGGNSRTLSLGANSTARAIAFDIRRNRLLIAGDFTTPGGDRDFIVFAVKLNGDLDDTFTDFGFVSFPWDIAGQDDDLAATVAVDRFGRVLVAGIARDDVNARGAVARILPDGNLDDSFGTSGKRLFDIVVTGDLVVVDSLVVLPQPREDIALAGTYDALLGSSSQGFVAVLPTSGVGFVNSFDGDGRRVLPLGNAGEHQLAGMVAQGGNLVVHTHFSAPDDDRTEILRLAMTAVFGDDFATGDLGEWSAKSP